MVDDEIRLIYHYKSEDISRATRTFIKPPIAERGDRLVFDPDMTHGYNVNLFLKIIIVELNKKLILVLFYSQIFLLSQKNH